MDLRRGCSKSEDNYSIRRPLYIPDLCLFIFDCIYSDNVGVYHFYNPHNKYTKYEICKIIAEYLEINIDHIIPKSDAIDDRLAPRPYDTNLCDDRIDFVVKYSSFTNFRYSSIPNCFSKFKHPKCTIANKSEFFIMMDMDGTMIQSNHAHYNSYKKVLEERNIQFLSFDEWSHLLSNGGIDLYLQQLFDEHEIHKIKSEKQKQLQYEDIYFTNGFEIFLQSLLENGFNFCVVTNTSKSTVEIFKQKLPLLRFIEKWICRDEYELSKPHCECYSVAKTKFYNNEKYILGIEDSIVGYQALKPHTDLIYIFNNETVFNSNDCFLFDDYSIFKL